MEKYTIEATTFSDRIIKYESKDSKKDAENVYKAFKVKYPKSVITLSKQLKVTVKGNETIYK